MVAALRECARELDRTPSSCAYRLWHPAAEQRRRGSTTYPSSNTISGVFADRGGWTAALEDAELLAPPTATVRVVAPDKKHAVELASALRAQGLLAAHAGNRNWVDVHAEISEVKRAIRESHQDAATVLTIWDPARKKLERHATGRATGAFQDRVAKRCGTAPK